jgi:hypothetical protein
MGIGMTKPMLFGQPFQRMNIDLVGPLNTTKAGYTYILSCIDAFTNYVMFVPLLNKEAATVVEAFFRKVICVHAWSSPDPAEQSGKGVHGGHLRGADGRVQRRAPHNESLPPLDEWAV